MALIYFLLPMVIFALIIIAPYFIILAGLKLLQIKGIPRNKVLVFYLLIIGFAFLMRNVINPFVFDNFNIISNTTNTIVYSLIRAVIYWLIYFFFLKYYFYLSGKKLWQFLLYLIVIDIGFSVLIFFLL